MIYIYIVSFIAGGATLALFWAWFSRLEAAQADLEQRLRQHQMLTAGNLRDMQDRYGNALQAQEYRLKMCEYGVCGVCVENEDYEEAMHDAAGRRGKSSKSAIGGQAAGRSV